MKNYRVTVIGASGSIHYDVFKTYRGALGFGKRLANEAFYGEQTEIKIEDLA